MTDYYAIDENRALSYRDLWSSTKAQEPPLALPLRLIVFAVIASRKLRGARSAAFCGHTRPASLLRIGEDALPAEVRQAFEPMRSELASVGFRTAFHSLTEYIGYKQLYYGWLLSETGRVHATLSWQKMRIGQQDITQVAHACHSDFESGHCLHTGPLASQSSGLIHPMETIVAVPLDTPPRRTAALHLEHLASRGTPVAYRNADELAGGVLRMQQRYFDWAVSARLLRRLTTAEVDRLRAADWSRPPS